LTDQQSSHFIIHVTPSFSYLAYPGDDFLRSIGLQPFEPCGFFATRCHWRHIATIMIDYHERARGERTAGAHSAFQAFASRLDELYESRKRERNILSTIHLESGPLPIFSDSPPVVTLDLTDIPPWVESVKYPRLRDLEGQRKTVEMEIAALSSYLALIHSTGDPLEEAVVKALTKLRLRAEK